MVESSVYKYPVFCAENPLPTGLELEQQTLGVVDGGLGALLVQLGYLANIWEKTCSPRRSGITVQRIMVTGHGQVDFLEPRSQAERGKRCSGAEIEIIRRPASTDVEFDPPEVIYVGKCGFFRGNEPLSGDNPREKLNFGGSVSIGLGARPGRNVAPAPALPAWGDQKSTGMTPLAWGYDVPPVVAGGVTFGGSVTVRLQGGTSATKSENFNFPVRYINFTRSIFNADRADATGFWWKLKPGVVANIYVYGAEFMNSVSFNSGGESGLAGEFNPMACGTLLQF